MWIHVTFVILNLNISLIYIVMFEICVKKYKCILNRNTYIPIISNNYYGCIYEASGLLLRVELWLLKNLHWAAKLWSNYKILIIETINLYIHNHNHGKIGRVARVIGWSRYLCIASHNTVVSLLVIAPLDFDYSSSLIIKYLLNFEVFCFNLLRITQYS